MVGNEPAATVRILDDDTVPEHPRIRWFPYQESYADYVAFQQSREWDFGLAPLGAAVDGLTPYGLWLDCADCSFSAPPQLARCVPDVAAGAHAVPVTVEPATLATQFENWLPLPGRNILLSETLPPIEDTVELSLRSRDGVWRDWQVVQDVSRFGPEDPVVLVQRGWAPRNFSRREELPPVQTPAGEVEVRGRLAPPPAQLYAFDQEERGAIRQNLDLGRFRIETGLPLLELSVQQAGPAAEGLRRDWPAAGSGAEKNYGYAFQWWSLAAVIAILYVWFQFVVPRRQARRP